MKKIHRFHQRTSITDAPMEVKKKKDKENSVTYMLHFKHDNIKKPTHRQQIIQPKETNF